MASIHPYRHAQKAIFTSVHTALHQYFVSLKFAFIQERARLSHLLYWLRSLTRRQWLTVGAVSFSGLIFSIVSLTVLFVNPKTHNFSYSQENCFFNPVILPNTVDQASRQGFKSELRPKISLGNTPLLSTSTCVYLTEVPSDQTKDTLTLESPISLQKTVSLTVPSLPQLTPFDTLKDPVSPTAVLLFNLDSPDETFNYTLTIEGKTTACVLQNQLLGCPLKDHLLGQGKSYNYSINRVINSSAIPIHDGSIITLDPVNVTDSSIKQNELVYGNPKNIVITTNKTISSIGKISLIAVETGADFPLNSQISANTLDLKFDTDLPRNTNFYLQIDSIKSEDGAFLSAPYTLSFKTSTGPKVQGINVASYKVSPTTSINLTFDIELDQSQSLSEVVSISDGTGQISANLSVQNNVISLRPKNSLSSCTSYTVSVNNNLKSKYGIAGESAYSTSFRTTCQQTFSIGSSVQGRSITGYKFGTGSSYVVFVGGLHGNEKSSTITLNSWVDELERSAQNIPSDKTIIVIPNTNPDGYAVSSRLNANGVDLNRNFPSNNWQTGVYVPRSTFLESGGGSVPLSEPESSSLADYLVRVSPRLVLTYHATAGAVISNGAGDASSLAKTYAQKSGFDNYEQDHEDAIFNYPTTGELEDWLRDKRATPTLLVELATMGSSEIRTQKSAMWAILSL